MKKIALIFFAAAIGAFLAYGVCWALIAFVNLEPNVAKWMQAERFFMMIFGTPTALAAGVFSATIAVDHS